MVKKISSGKELYLGGESIEKKDVLPDEMKTFFVKFFHSLWKNEKIRHGKKRNLYDD